MREHRQSGRVLPASAVSGNRVRNPAGEDLGKLEEVMIDISTGRAVYAVISFGGFLGIGDKLFAVPWQALTFDERGQVFLMHVDRKELERAPGFNPNRWPDMADPSWSSAVDEFYGTRDRGPATY